MIVGIDLGTTNSLVAAWIDGAPRLIPNTLGTMLTPSCVGVDEDGSVLVGDAARDRLQTHPELTTALFKRDMGSARTVRLGDDVFRPEELSALVLRSLRADAEAALGVAVTEAIVTVPAHFSDAQRRATRSAAALAGLRVTRLLNETTAAALAYGLPEAQGEDRFLVFNLGGGTFDVSVIERFEGIVEVRASAGDPKLGGEDFTNLIVDEAFRSGLPDDAREDALFMQGLAARAEAAKHTLGAGTDVDMTIAWKDREARVTLDPASFERLAQPLLNRLWRPIERAMRDARVRAADLDAIVLAGGATRMPMIRALVTRMFGRSPVLAHDPDEIAALGAAVQAALHMREKALDERAVTDVCPHTIGIEVMRQLEDGTRDGGFFAPVIQRNSVAPVRRIERFRPTEPHQCHLGIRIFQGESRRVRDNILLGEITVALTPGAGHADGVDVRFDYDVDGLLDIEATVVQTGEAQSVTLGSGETSRGTADIAARLPSLATHGVHPAPTSETRSPPTPPPFLQQLGLSGYADDTAVRRAYAQRLKATDPVADPQAFGRLRDAYVAARAWVLEQPEVPVAGEPVDTTTGSAGTDAVPSEPGHSHDVAAAQMATFVDALRLLRPRDVPDRLEATVTALRMQYIDAPGQFEERLIDLLRDEGVTHRAVLFDASTVLFHWQEIGHAAQLGQRGAWIESVLSQRAQWDRLPIARRDGWIAWFERMQGGVDEALVAHWPQVAALRARFPALITLYVSSRTLDAWRTAFEALPERLREKHRRLAPSPATFRSMPLHTRVRRLLGRTPVTAGLFLLLMVLAIVRFALPASNETTTQPSTTFGFHDESPAACAALYAIFDRPDGLASKTPADVSDLKARAARCADAGLWHRQP